MAVSYGTYTITEVQEGSQIWTTTVAPSSPNYTFTISNLTGDSEASIKVGDIIMYSYYRYTVLSISDDGTTVLTGNRVSIRGATGAASVTYTLIVSNLAIIKDKDGNLSPSSITVTAKSQTGSNTMANYTGRIQIETTTDNSTWTSRVNEDASTKIYTIPTDTTAVRCSLYLKGGTTTLLDQQTIPVVSDGTDGTNGTNGKDAYTVILTNDNHTFAGDSTHATASEVDCGVIAYKGATQVAATIGSISGQPTGMTTSITDNSTTNAYFTVSVTTSMTAKNGTLTVPITVDGKTFTKKFTYSLALDGVSVVNVTSTNNTTDGGTSIITITMSDGNTKTFNVKNGNKGSTGDTAEWFYGTELTHESGTATATISGAVIGSMYLNTETSLVYKCTDISNGTMTWTYAGDLTTGVINNIEIGGRNLLKGSDVTNTSLTTPLRGGTATQVIPSGTTITLSVQVDADDVVWDSSGNKRIGVASSIVKDGGGNQYIEAWAAMTGRTGTGIDKTFDTSFHGRVKSTYTLQGELPLDKAFNLYVQSVTSGTVSVSRPKLEIGNKATDWTPAPEDVDADIEEAKKVATNYLSVDSTGIMIANMSDGEQQTPSNATGRNVFIDNDSVEIRDGNITLAQFSENGVRIGNESNHDIIANFSNRTFQLGFDNQSLFYINCINGEDGLAHLRFMSGAGADGTYPSNLQTSTEIASLTSAEYADGTDATEDITIIDSHRLVVANRKNMILYVRYTSEQALGHYTLGSRPTDLTRGIYSMSIGYDNAAMGEGSLSVGQKNRIVNGESTVAGFSFAMGYDNKVTSFCSQAMGSYCEAKGSNSHAHGTHTIASCNAQTAIGKYNIEDTNDKYAFIIGNGDSNTGSNAFAVDWNGNVEFSGNMYCAGGNYLPFGTDIDNLTKKHSGWWVYNRSDVSGTFPISDTYGRLIMWGCNFCAQIIKLPPIILYTHDLKWVVHGVLGKNL